MSVASVGEHVVVAGNFFPANRSVFTLSTRTGTVLPWNPSVQGEVGRGSVNLLAAYPDVLVMAGRFTRVEGRPVRNLAVLPATGPRRRFARGSPDRKPS